MKKYLYLILTVVVMLLCTVSVHAAPANISWQQRLEWVRKDGETFPAFDLTAKEAWNATDDDGDRTTYDDKFMYHSFGTGLGGYYQVKASPDYPSYTQIISRMAIENMKPNTTYRMSLLANTNIDKKNCEVVVGFKFYNDGYSESSDDDKLFHATTGLPVNTNGAWQKVEFDFTTPAAPSDTNIKGNFYLLFADQDYDETKYDYTTRNLCYLTCLQYKEIANTALEPLGPGEGLTFGGSSGSLGMKVESVSTYNNVVTVTTSGAQFEFNKSNNTITGIQTINQERKVSTLTVDKSLANLSVLSRSDNEVILTTGEDGVSFGVQMDGLMLISNHGSTDLNVTCTSDIAGEWNRLAYGHLIAMDKIGGFTINPAIPQGTGRIPRYVTDGTLDFDGKFRDTTFLSSEPKGWSLTYTISSGELLGYSVFPPREFDWDAFYNFRTMNETDDNFNTNYHLVNQIHDITSVTLWNFTERGYGMSNSSVAQVKDEGKYPQHKIKSTDEAYCDCGGADKYTHHIIKAKEAGVTPRLYISFYFWHNRDVDEYLAEVKRHKDTYGIEGVYSDGLPSSEWLESYKCMRGLRELFPDGSIYVHATGISENGGPPLSTPDIFIPAIETYADALLRAEDVTATGMDWVYPEYGTNGIATTGTPIHLKGNRWKDANGTILSDMDLNLLNIIHNSFPRAIRNKSTGLFYDDDLNVMDILEKMWHINGQSENYLEKYYQPLAKRLIRPVLTSNDVKTIVYEDFADLSDNWTIEQDMGTNARSGSNMLELLDDGIGRCSATKSFPVENNRVSAEFNLTYSGKGPYFISFLNEGKEVTSIMIFNEKLYCTNGFGAYEEICKIESNIGHAIKLKVDCPAQKINVILDGKTVVSEKAFFEDAYSVDAIKFSTDYATKGIAHINTLLMKTTI